MGIACAPHIWKYYVSMIIGSLHNKSKYITIMDNLLIHSAKNDHCTLLEDLYKDMIKNGLKLSPKKCQLFRTTLTYMGNDFKINNRIMTITPLKTRMEAIQKYPLQKPPKTVKVFVG